ncbi:TPA: hypothetical protein HA241_06500 [Candidatus Woesearchaeota archaeon]|nr:hypothetical protein [Candidatus Woesearchaeota archaeon]
MKSRRKYVDIIVFGGNRQKEDGPLITFCLEAKKLGYSLFVFTDPLHSALPAKDGDFCYLLNKHNIHHKVTASLNYDHIKRFVGPTTLGISINSCWIFKDDIITLFGERLINYHGAKLPEERGAAAYSWKIMRGERMGQLTLHQIVRKIDSGQVCKKMNIDFPDKVKCPSDFYVYMEKKERMFFRRFLQRYRENNVLDFNPLAFSKSYYWPPLHTLTHGWIDWSWNDEQVCDFINAFSSPFQGASTYLKGERVFLRGSSLSSSDLHFHPFQSGIIVRILNDDIFVVASNGLIQIHELKNENGNSIITKVREGDRFYTPYDELNSARCSKVIRKPTGYIIRNYEEP